MPEKKQMEFRAVWADESETRTELQSDGTSVWWTPGEEINVFYGDTFSGRFTSTNTTNKALVSFQGTLTALTGTVETGNEASAYWAVYPYDAANTCDSHNVILTVPEVQTGKAGSFADKMFPAVATSHSQDLAFYNVCGGARFSVSQTGIISVTFRANGGEPLVGTVQVGLGSDGFPVVKSIVEGKSEVTVSAPEGGFIPGNNYFVAFLPQTLSQGLSMTFENRGHAATYTTEHSITVNRSRFGELDEKDQLLSFNPIPVEGVFLDKTSLEVEIDRYYSLIATIFPENAAEKTVTWSSSNEAIATVSSDGVVTGVAVGSAVITVTANDGGKTASCNVTVKEIEPKVPVPDAVDLGLPSGLKWASFNLGASKPEGYGKYYAWGETEPKAEYNWGTYKWCMGAEGTITKYCRNASGGYNGFTDGKIVLDPGDDAAHVNLGGKWRMPLQEELDELLNYCSSETRTQNGVYGLKFTGPNGKSIFFPAAGRREDASSVYSGNWGEYWSLSFNYPSQAYSLLFTRGLSELSISLRNRSWGLSVRPVTE